MRNILCLPHKLDLKLDEIFKKAYLKWEFFDIQFFEFFIWPIQANFEFKKFTSKNGLDFEAGFSGTRKMKFQKKLFNIKNFFY